MWPLAKSACGSGPSLDVFPVPDHCGDEGGDGFREVGVSASPFVDDLWAGDAEPDGDFVGADEVGHFNTACHIGQP